MITHSVLYFPARIAWRIVSAPVRHWPITFGVLALLELLGGIGLCVYIAIADHFY